VTLFCELFNPNLRLPQPLEPDLKTMTRVFPSDHGSWSSIPPSQTTSYCICLFSLNSTQRCFLFFCASLSPPYPWHSLVLHVALTGIQSLNWVESGLLVETPLLASFNCLPPSFLCSTSPLLFTVRFPLCRLTQATVLRFLLSSP